MKKKKKNKSRITAIIKTEILSQYSQEYLKSSKKKKMKWCQPHPHCQMERHKPDIWILTCIYHNQENQWIKVKTGY